MSQYGYSLDCGRRGATFAVYRLDESAQTVYTWNAIFNSRVIDVTRISHDGVEVVLSNSETFLYPDRVEDDELDLMDVMSGAPVAEDHDFIRLCSLLVAKFSAGHSEESLHDAIRPTLKKWSEETT